MILKAAAPTSAEQRRPQPESGLAAGHPKGLALTPARTVPSWRAGEQLMLHRSRTSSPWSIRNALDLDEHRSIERYQRILTEELLYARPFTSEAQRAQAIHYGTSTTTTIDPTPPPGTSRPLSASDPMYQRDALIQLARRTTVGQRGNRNEFNNDRRGQQSRRPSLFRGWLEQR